MEPVSLTKQEWFNNAWKRAHNPVQSMFTPGYIWGCGTYNKSIHGGCFIGCSVLDNRLDNSQFAASDLIHQALIAVSDAPREEATKFLNELQWIHDRTPPSSWHEKLRDFANGLNLGIPNE